MDRRITPRGVRRPLFPEAKRPTLGISSKGQNVRTVFTQIARPRLSITQNILPENCCKPNCIPMGLAYAGWRLSFLDLTGGSVRII